MKRLYYLRNAAAVDKLYRDAAFECLELEFLNNSAYRKRVKIRAFGRNGRKLPKPLSPHKLFLIDWVIPAVIGYIYGYWMWEWFKNDVPNILLVILIFASSMFLGGLILNPLGRFLKGER